MKTIDLFAIKIWECVTQSIRKIRTDEGGIGTVEMILILVVLIGLVLIFKEKLSDLVGSIFDTIESQSSSV